MSAPTPYWEDDDAGLALYHGDMREVLPALGLQADLMVADPPYAETSLEWDRWPDGWLETAAAHTQSMWCFGSQRMFFERLPEFQAADWHMSHDVIGRTEDGAPTPGEVTAVWEKNNGTGRASDRFRRIHEHAIHWYRGPWRDIHHEGQRHAAPPTDSDRPLITGVRVRKNPDDIPHAGRYAPQDWIDDGTRLMTSVIRVKNLRGLAIHPTEKPIGILDPLIRYGCPPGGLVVDPFAGSGSTLDAARQSGRRAIGIEADERYCEAAALRLSQLTLEVS